MTQNISLVDNTWVHKDAKYILAGFMKSGTMFLDYHLRKLDIKGDRSLDFWKFKGIEKLQRAYYGDIPVIFCVRNKKDFIRSIKQHYHINCLESLKASELRELSNYDTTIDKYKKLFSKVIVIRFEDLIKDPQRVVDKLCTEVFNVKPKKIKFERVNKTKKWKVFIPRFILSKWRDFKGS